MPDRHLVLKYLNDFRTNSSESVSGDCRLPAPQMFENAIQLPELQDKARVKQGSLEGVEVALCAGQWQKNNQQNQDTHLRF